MLKVGGENVSPAEIEGLLAGFAGVAQIASGLQAARTADDAFQQGAESRAQATFAGGGRAHLRQGRSTGIVRAPLSALRKRERRLELPSMGSRAVQEYQEWI